MKVCRFFPPLEADERAEVSVLFPCEVALSFSCEVVPFSCEVVPFPCEVVPLPFEVVHLVCEVFPFPFSEVCDVVSVEGEGEMVKRRMDNRI